MAQNVVLKRFIAADDGVITMDWVALTSSVVSIGLGLVYMIYGGEDGSISSMITNFQEGLTTSGNNLSGAVGDPPPPLK